MKPGKLMTNGIPFSNPPHHPAYGKPPYLYRNAEVIQIAFETTYEAIADIIPAPLEVDDVPVGVCMFSNIPFCTTLGAYHECIVMFSVTFEGKRYFYLPNLYLDSDIPMLCGRELYGYAKKLAKIDVLHELNRITFKMERPEGNSLITASVTPVDNQPFEFYQNTDIISLKLIPNAQEDKMDVAQLVGCKYWLTPVTGTDGIAELYTGIGSVSFNGASNDDPIHNIPINKINSALYGKFNIHLPFGYIMHDYLK